MADPAEDRGDNLDDLAPDATLATDIPDEAARREEQLQYYGGEKDDLDDEDFSVVDRGDSLEPPELEDEEEEEEQAAKDEDEDSDELDDGEPDADADTEEAVDDDEESDAEEGDDGDVAESDADDDEPQDKSGRDQRIPLSRFNEVNERMKRAEARLAQLEQQEQAVEEVAEGKYDFDAAEEEYTELLLNGDTKGAATKRAEIRSAEREAFLLEAQMSTKETITEDAMMSELNELTTQAAERYPLFSDKSEDFDPVATQKVLTFMRGYMSEDMSPGDAFVAALADGVELLGLDARYGYLETDPEPDRTPRKKAPKKKVKEKIELSEKQPKSPAGHGKGSADAGAVVPDIEKMSDAEIDALPADTLARLRGDYVD